MILEGFPQVPQKVMAINMAEGVASVASTVEPLPDPDIYPATQDARALMLSINALTLEVAALREVIASLHQPREVSP